MPRYDQTQARKAIAESVTWTEALRKLDRCPTGGAPVVLKKWAARWGIPTDHFDPNIPRRAAATARGKTPEEVFVAGSSATRKRLKDLLYREGLRSRACELCGQGEMWHGRRLSLVLDHINGIRDDNRLENLRVVCPNCNATLDTHCGRASALPPLVQVCAGCANEFVSRRATQRYCSPSCASRHAPRRRTRTRPLPDVGILIAMVGDVGYLATGREYKVSATTIRKWIKVQGVEPPPGRGNRHNRPPRPDRLLGPDRARQALELLAEGTSMYAVAKRFGVDRNTIRDLRRGLTYKELERPAAVRNAA